MITEYIERIIIMQNQRILSKIIRKETRCDGENTYSYELFSCEGDNLVSFRLPLYSIKITMTDSQGNVKHADAKDAFSDASKALVFFDKIVRNLATPIDLAYIIEDEYFN